MEYNEYMHTGWRLMPVVFGRNGKIRPQYASVNGEPLHFPVSYYTLRHFEGAKTVSTRLGDNATDALNEWERQKKIRRVKTDAVGAGVRAIEPDTIQHNLKGQKKKWLEKL